MPVAPQGIATAKIEQNQGEQKSFEQFAKEEREKLYKKLAENERLQKQREEEVGLNKWQKQEKNMIKEL